MHFDVGTRPAALRHDPFKALVVPRPIGWVGTLDAQGRPNLAPYSFFNGVSDRPPMVMFASAGRKDSLRNVQDTGEFTVSICGFEQRDAMNLSSAPLAPGVDEFAAAGLQAVPGQRVKAPRVGGAPAALECRLWQTLAMPGDNYVVVFGTVVALYIDDRFVRDGRVDTGAMRVVSRLGYMDYGVLEPVDIFTLTRPLASDDGQRVLPPPAEWDGKYR
ncbi:MAG: flavin reductase family protein [Rubrivivax sp.]|nr:flavin reductase family protein [Rubrivivax sp.]